MYESERLEKDSQFSHRMRINPLMDYLKIKIPEMLLGIGMSRISYIQE
jgi:hypothetical protein